jgi:hypothetical protein
MRVVAIALDLSRSANVLPVPFGNTVGVTVGNSGLLQVRNKLFVSLEHLGSCLIVSLKCLERVLPRHSHIDCAET